MITKFKAFSGQPEYIIYIIYVVTSCEWGKVANEVIKKTSLNVIGKVIDKVIDKVYKK